MSNNKSSTPTQTYLAHLIQLPLPLRADLHSLQPWLDPVQGSPLPADHHLDGPVLKGVSEQCQVGYSNMNAPGLFKSIAAPLTV